MALPERDEEYLQGAGFRWSLTAASGEQLLVLHDYALPVGKYTPSSIDLMIRIPAGYPAHGPDMFFVRQVVQLPNGAAPMNVSPTTINGESWHQWSRHYPPGVWRPGRDGLECYMRAVRTELERGR